MTNIPNINQDQLRSIISFRFLRPGFDFWFTDHEHIRSPFPKEIRADVESRTTDTFFEWITGQKEDELNNIDEDMMVEMFETILFNEAFKQVDDEDQQLTISYPFLPRVGDRVNDHLNEAGEVIHRKAIAEKDQNPQLELTVYNKVRGTSWNTRIELTAKNPM